MDMLRLVEVQPCGLSFREPGNITKFGPLPPHEIHCLFMAQKLSFD